MEATSSDSGSAADATPQRAEDTAASPAAAGPEARSPAPSAQEAAAADELAALLQATRVSEGTPKAAPPADAPALPATPATPVDAATPAAATPRTADSTPATTPAAAPGGIVAVPEAAPLSAFASFRAEQRVVAKEANAAAALEAAAAAAEAKADAAEAAEAAAQAAAKGAPAPRVGLIYSADMEKHAGPASHPECPQRHACVVRRFESSGLAARCALLTPRPATEAEALRAHSAAHLSALDALFQPDGDDVQEKGDLYWNAHTAAAARLSAGCAVTAALAVCRAELDAAFAVIRPPGHHAECDRAMGFCFLNNASIAALAALEEPGIERVLILDWDVHHGNGIEAIHYSDPRVLYVSLHRYSVDPATWFYPGTGAVSDCGQGPGTGFTVNVPWPERGCGDADYVAAFELVIEPIAKAFAPDLVLISAGFDAAFGDPLGGMQVSADGYHAMAAKCAGMASKGRCVALLEGGYNLAATAEAAEATLRGLLGEAPPPLPKRSRPRRSTEGVLRGVLAAQARHWPVLSSVAHAAAVDAHFAGLHLAAAALLEATPSPAAARRKEKEKSAQAAKTPRADTAKAADTHKKEDGAA